MHTTPPSLLLRVAEHDDKAWGEFVELYTPLLMAWAKKSRLNDDQAAELIQEVFVALLTLLPRFTYDKNRSFRAWLYTVIRNRWIDVLRRKRIASPGDAGLSSAQAAADIVELEETEFRNSLIRRALELVKREFGPATVAAFQRTALEERPAAEVASELGMSEDAVYQAKSRVMRKLKEHLAGMWDD